MAVEGPAPWERLSDESAKAFAAFQMYRDQPTMERSQRRLAANLDRMESQIFEWSSKYRWVERVTAWDAEQDRLLQLQVAKERKDFAKRLAASGALMQAKGLGKVRNYQERYDRDGQAVALRPGQEFIDEMSVTDASRLIEVGARLEALGRGLPPEDVGMEVTNVQIVNNPVLAALMVDPARTPEAIEAMETLVKALGIGSGEPPVLLPDTSE